MLRTRTFLRLFTHHWKSQNKYKHNFHIVFSHSHFWLALSLLISRNLWAVFRCSWKIKDFTHLHWTNDTRQTAIEKELSHSLNYTGFKWLMACLYKNICTHLTSGRKVRLIFIKFIIYCCWCAPFSIRFGNKQQKW